ncbi:type IX secretion system membrane protein PorP/SprF [Flavobacteriaceae bacterium]|nr:type IX secretion system membrane protein PorP/SprF [Flavobacteriaceae bacterium]
MKNISLIHIILFFMLFKGLSQEDLIVSHSRFLQKENTSAFGINNMNKTGVLYNSLGLTGNSKIESRYFFGSISFDDKNFSIGLDIYSFTMNNVGLVNSKPRISYIYKVQLDNDLYFLPSISLGLGSSRFDQSNLIFEDQLSLVSGYLQTESQDPLYELLGSSSYIDFGASFLIHSNNFLAGLSLKHLNQPNISYLQETELKLPIKFSVQGAYEWDVNPYDRRWLPRYSSLLAFFNASKSGNDIEMYLSQEFQLGEVSIGLNQQFKKISDLSFTNVGISFALAYENFEFGTLYNFPFQNPTNTSVYSPSTIEVFLTFDFSPYRRNKRGDYRRISIDNYY